MEGGGGVQDRIPLDRSFALMPGGPERRTLFVMAAVRNAQDPFGSPRTGQVPTAAAPGAGWPAA